MSDLASIAGMEFFAYVGEAEDSQYNYPGIKQAITKVGIVPIVVVKQHWDRLENNHVQEQMEAMAAAPGGKKIYLVRLVVAEIVTETKAGM